MGHQCGSKTVILITYFVTYQIIIKIAWLAISLCFKMGLRRIEKAFILVTVIYPNPIFRFS